MIQSPEVGRISEAGDECLRSQDTCLKVAENTYDVIILNYANADMVGHTGFFELCK